MELSAVFALLGGLGLFLYGMHMMGEGLEKAAGGKMRRLLEILTRNKYLAVLVGAAVTAVIQSSSATTVMVVGFVNAGLMELTQAVGVIMGANIGTTITGQMIATLNMKDLAPILAFVGVIMIMMFKGKTTRAIGQVLAGLGILFIGMDTMSASMKPLQENEGFQQLLVSFQNPFMGILVGAVFTAIIQSSSASTGILQALAAQGLIGLDGAMFVLFGQNIGTCVTALLASVGTTRAARRTAVIHLLFNLIGTIIFVILALTLPLARWVEAISPLGPMQQIANTHTIFNVVTTLLLLPASNLLVRMACRLVPGSDPVTEPMALKYLNDQVMVTPMLAVTEVVKEVERMGELTHRNLKTAMDSFLDGDMGRTKEVLDHEQVINYLNHQITTYLVRINALALDDRESRLVGSLYHVVNDLERIGDHAENIVEYTRNHVENGVSYSDAAIAEMRDVSERVDTVLHDALYIFNRHSALPGELDQLTDKEEEIDQLTDQLRDRHIQRLNEGLCSPESGMDFVDLLINLERVSDHATNIAYSVAN